MVTVILSWLIVGAIVGFIASKIVDLRGDEPMIGIIAAVIGGAIGGLVYRMRAVDTYEGWSVGNVIAVAIGAAVAVTIYHLIRSRSIDKTQQSIRHTS